jgi:hypothetical protein
MRHARLLPPTAVLVCVALVPAIAATSVLDVPLAYPTIQQAINAATDGDTVRVAPGHYVELIDFLGKNIVVESAAGPDVTTIDGNGTGTVVVIDAAAGETPTLRGFTIRGGNASGIGGGGLLLFGGPALVEGNVVTANFGCPGGIAAQFSEATIRNNVISDNRPNCSGGPGGGGILVGGAGAVQLLGNLIDGNVSGGDGGGVSLFAAGSPVVSGNTIVDNASGGGAGGWGGGIVLFNASDALITNNVIARNDAFAGGGITWLVPFGQRGPNVVNNTIALNTALQGTAVFADGFDAETSLRNNVLVGAGESAVVVCGDLNDLNPPMMRYNDVFHVDGGPAYGGFCSDQTGLNGNVSVDPLFVDAPTGDFHLRPESPVVDAGEDDDAPPIDIDGDQRPADGNGDGVPRVDVGADEVLSGSEDTTPPTLTCSVTPTTMWPPNHRLRSVDVSILASDDSGTAVVTLLSVASNQPEAGMGPGDQAGDRQGWAIGSDDRSGLLRAERAFDARTYTLVYQAADPSGNAATCTVAVTVPHDQGNRR